MNWLRLALRLLLREWRAGELAVVAFALAIAVTGITSIGFVGDRIRAAMDEQAARFLGADRLLRSPNALPAEWLAEARARGLRLSEAMAFGTMAVAGENMQLVSAKAVDEGYPLRGTLLRAEEPYAPGRLAERGPGPGEVWLESRLLALLGVKLGDAIGIGEVQLKLTAVLIKDPGEAGDMFNVAPGALMNRADVAASKLVQPGSRVSYLAFLAGGETALSAYEAWLKPKLGETARLMGGKQGSDALGNALERAENYLSLAGLISVVLAGIAIAMAAQRYAERHYDMSAVLRCFGASRRQVLAVFAGSLLLLGLAASLVGSVLGYGAHEILAEVLKERLPENLPPPGWQPVGVGLVSGVVILVGFALPALIRLQRVPPLRVLKRDLDPVPAATWAVYALASLTLGGLMVWHSGSWRLTAIVLGGGALGTALLSLVAWGGLHLAGRLAKRFTAARRFGVSHLERHRRQSLIQILAFGMTMTVMLSILLVRTDLLTAWQMQLPADAPNHFLVNIQPDEAKPIADFFAAQGLRRETLYPMVRGRLIAKNGTPIREAVPEMARDDNALRRELNLSWGTERPADNKILQGRWWQPGDAGRKLISVESLLAERFGFRLGDRLSFQIGDQTVEAEIASLRKVQWDSFHPNFYVMFSPGVIEHYPSAWITSLYLAPERKRVLNDLVRAFPTVTVIEVDQLMAEVKTILDQITAAVEFLLGFVLLAGFAVLAACLQATMDERLFEAVVLRTLGASRRFLRAALSTEFLSLGLLAGLLAAVASEGIAWGLYTQVFSLEPAFHPWLWLAGAGFGMAAIGLGGALSSRRILNEPPLNSLRAI
ncbi:MAG: FtsX-like permease family protein [Gammaproteobacteria bacterium]|nr:FtsX-like permease family protein [Gammaproteobacteria bacterium]